VKNALSGLMSAKTITFSAAILAVATPAFAVGCSSSSSSTGSVTVGATAVAYNRSTHALADSALTTVNGTYGAGCLGHASATDAWTLTIPTSTANNVAVVAGNTACVLTVTTLLAGATVYHTAPGIVMTGGTFAASASQYFDQTDTLAFYANAELVPADFSGDFAVNVFTSDDPNDVLPTTVTGTQFVVGSASQSGIAAPTYTESNTLALTDDTDGGVVSSVGNASFTLVPQVAPQAGEAWLIAPNGFVASFAADDAAFTAGPANPFVGDPLVIPSTAFGLNGTRAPETRTVIIQHVDTPSGDKTYETFQFAFNPGP
jgi:hypothetical protein